MRSLTLSILLCTGQCLFGQTYYYINSISVDPAAPTTQDVVSITLHGDLSNTAAMVTGVDHAVNGNAVTLTVNAAQPGIGLDVLTPHEETFNLGPLGAGTYHITIGGASIADLAPVQQHSFVVSGASICDSVSIFSVSWQPFTDTALEVYASYPLDQGCIDYPGFILLNGTDTVASETVNFFCLADASHALSLGSAPVPEGTFDGELQLWSNFYSEQVCTFDLQLDLCPPGPCTQLLAYVNNFGDALADAMIDWTVSDQDAVVQASGQFHLHDAQQSEYDTLCLPPGQYTLTAISAQPLTGGQLVLGVTSGHMYALDRSVPIPQGAGGATLPFTFYGPCIGANGIPSHPESAGLLCGSDGNAISIGTADERPIGPFTVVDARGSVLYSSNGTANTARIPCGAWAPGVYVLRTIQHGTRAFMR